VTGASRARRRRSQLNVTLGKQVVEQTQQIRTEYEAFKRNASVSTAFWKRFLST